MLNRKTLLLVEDEVIIALGEKRFLEREGFEVIHAKTGEQAVEIALDDNHDIDLVLMDIDLGPGIDGTEAAQRILTARPVPIVFLSSHTEKEYTDRAEQITSYGYIVKNSGETVLITSIKMAFRLFEANTSLRRSEEQFRLLAENARDLVYRIDLLPERRFSYVSPSAYTITGYTPEEHYADPDLGMKLVHPSDQDRLLALMENGNAFEEPLVLRWCRKDGTVIWTEQNNVPVFDGSGALVAIEGIARDITERIELEESLRRSEDLFKKVFEILPIGLWIADKNGNLMRGNPAGIMIWGGEPKVDQSGYGVFKARRLPSREEVKPKDWALAHTVNRGVTIVDELLEIEAFDGKTKTILNYTAPILDGNGEIEGAIVVNQDITEQEQLEKINQSLLSIIEMSPNFIGVADKKQQAFFVNPAGRKMVGLDGDDAVGATIIDDYFFEEDLPFFTETILPALSSEGRWIGEFRFRNFKTGEAIPVLYDLFFTKDPETGEFTNLTTISRDITSHKRTEVYHDMGREILQILNGQEDLRESIQQVLTLLKKRTEVDAVGIRLQEGDDYPYYAQEGFSNGFLLNENTLVERGRDGGVCKDKDGNVRLECTCGLVISGKADPSNPLFTQGGSSWTNDSFPFLELPSDQDPRTHPRNNCIHWKYASIALIPVRTSDRIVGLIQLNDKRKDRFTLETIEILEGIAAQIGSALMRKRAEEGIQKQLAEKETLLREVHHRMKNNMANVESLLSLQVGSVSSSEAKAALLEASSRVQSVRMLYDKLLLNESYQEISFKPYAEELIDSILSVYLRDKGISVKRTIAEFDISGRKAISVGIIVNELLTNAFKYAFTDRDAGSVTITITKSGNTITLAVEDDGIGIDNKRPATESTGLGLTIVKMLTEQLGGSYSVRTKNGTKSTVQFEL